MTDMIAIVGTGYVENVLKGVSGGLETVLTALGVLLGVVLLFVAAWKFFKAVTDSNQRVQNITVGVFALIVGGFLATNAFNRLSDISKGVGDQVNEWGTGGAP